MTSGMNKMCTTGATATKESSVRAIAKAVGYPPHPPLIPPAELHLMRLIHEHSLQRVVYGLSPIQQRIADGRILIERRRRIMEDFNLRTQIKYGSRIR